MTSINSVSSASSASSKASSSSSSSLSEETTKKLKALGLDPSQYSSEAEAQSAIKQAQAQQAQNQGKEGDSQGQSSSTSQNIQDEATTLAGSMGLSTSNDASVSDILNAISTKLTSIKSSDDQEEKSKYASFESQYETIENEYTKMTAAQNMTGATAQGTYNKASLGIS